MRNKIRLETLSEIKEFVDIVTSVEGKVTLESSDGFKVNAKSFLAAMCTVEWTDLWCVSEEDIYTEIKKYVL